MEDATPGSMRDHTVAHSHPMPNIPRDERLHRLQRTPVPACFFLSLQRQGHRGPAASPALGTSHAIEESWMIGTNGQGLQFGLQSTTVHPSSPEYARAV
jgi:hypothetical protein